MRGNINYFFSILIFYFFIASCSGPAWVKETERRAPIESFVFIKATVKLERCLSIDDQSICTVEHHGSTASGLSIGNIGNSSVVLTAGHLCEVDSKSLYWHQKTPPTKIVGEAFELYVQRLSAGVEVLVTCWANAADDNTVRDHFTIGIDASDDRAVAVHNRSIRLDSCTAEG